MSKPQQKSTAPAATAVRPTSRKVTSAQKLARDTAGKAKTTTSKAKSTTSKAKTTTGKAKSNARPVPMGSAPDLYGSLHALLHTMRLIEQHEESLCSMHDELKRTGRLSAARRRELQGLAADLPAADYQADLHALRQALAL